MRNRAFSLCVVATFYASATLSAPPPKEPFTEQLSRYPQEKLYVHTDKEHYIAGDTVWLRAHCVDAAGDYTLFMRNHPEDYPLPQAPARGRPARRRKIPARGAPARVLRRILLPRRGLSGQRILLPCGLQGVGRRRTPALLGGGAARRQGPLHRLPAHTPCGYRQRGVPAPCRTALHGRVPRPEGTSAPLRTPRCQGLYLRAARRPHRLDLHSLHPFGTQLAAARTAARGAPLRHAVLQQGVGSAGANAHLPPRGAARGAVSSAAPRRSDGQGPLRAAGLQPRRRSPPPASRDDGAR